MVPNSESFGNCSSELIGLKMAFICCRVVFSVNFADDVVWSGRMMEERQEKNARGHWGGIQQTFMLGNCPLISARTYIIFPFFSLPSPSLHLSTLPHLAPHDNFTPRPNRQQMKATLLGKSSRFVLSLTVLCSTPFSSRCHNFLSYLSIYVFFINYILYNGRTILECTLKRINAGNWVDLAQNRNYWRALVNAALNLRNP